VSMGLSGGGGYVDVPGILDFASGGSEFWGGLPGFGDDGPIGLWI
jgi:hypothetical protein